MNIFVAKLDYGTNSEDLQAAFEPYGSVSSAKVIYDRFTNNSRGFGFVEMDNDEEALQAIEALNDSQLDGRYIVVKEARPNNENRGNRRSHSSYDNNYNRW